jgi:Zn-dependent peptidase ImmA (M78 family)
MTVRMEVEPRLLEWAAERSGRDPEDLVSRFPKLEEWIGGEVLPTMKQLEDYGRATYTPVGYFFLEEPPEEQLPVPDFRTLPNGVADRPSPNLLDWYRRLQAESRAEALDFVGSVTLGSDVVLTASLIQQRINYGPEVRRQSVGWADAFAAFRDRVEEAGVLVMVSGVVGANTHRKLDPDEFRGFALVDPTAPVVFVNGADTRAAQIFTLAHELVHVWLGQPALSNQRLDLRETDGEVERWCNAVAGEFLVPVSELNREFIPDAPLNEELQRLARHFRVSTLVVLRRIFDAEYLTWDEYREVWSSQLALALNVRRTSGGNFYNTQPVRASKRFTKAVLADTLEGRTLYDEAFQLLGIKKKSTFDELSDRLEVS